MVDGTGLLLSRAARETRLIELNETSGHRVGKSLVYSPWPRPINAHGFPTGCYKRPHADDVLMVAAKGDRRRWIEAAIEIASGVCLRASWQCEPTHCLDQRCMNAHHWTVFYDPARGSAERPPANKIGRGFEPRIARADPSGS